MLNTKCIRCSRFHTCGDIAEQCGAPYCATNSDVACYKIKKCKLIREIVKRAAACRYEGNSSR